MFALQFPESFGKFNGETKRLELRYYLLIFENYDLNQLSKFPESFGNFNGKTKRLELRPESFGKFN